LTEAEPGGVGLDNHIVEPECGDPGERLAEQHQQHGQGRLDELVDMWTALIADRPAASDGRAFLARSYADTGRDHQARQLLDAEATAGFSLPRNYVLLPALALWAETAARLRDRAAAAMLLQRLAPWPDQVVYTGEYVLGAVAHYLGHLATVLGRHDTAETHFTHAQAIHARLQAPFHLARTHLEWGRMLSARAQPGDHHAARAHLQTARDLAQPYGCALVEQRATELLR
jgi:tetratricopeptide (TPR) repeat protein